MASGNSTFQRSEHFRSNSLISGKNVRPIAPAGAPSSTDANQQAQLLLRWPGGETMQLSNLPFLQNPGKNSSSAKRDGQEQAKKSPKKVFIYIFKLRIETGKYEG